MSENEFYTMSSTGGKDPEEMDFLVCALEDGPSHFTDNLVGKCCDCGRNIIYRPYSPKKPPKICIECVMDRVSGGNA